MKGDTRSPDYSPIVPYITLYIAVSISCSILLSICFSIIQGNTRSLMRPIAWFSALVSSSVLSH